MKQIQYLQNIPLTTAHLAQTMTLLHMTLGELQQKIESDLANNPALEIIHEQRCPNCKRVKNSPGPCPICSRPFDKQDEQPIVFLSSRDDFTRFSKSGFQAGDDRAESFAAEKEDLPTHVLRQIAPDLPEEDRHIAAHILTSIDDYGLLPISLFEISQYHHVSISRVESVLSQIQRSDPLGVGSPSVEDALLIQLEVLADRQYVPPLAKRAITDGKDLLYRHKHAELAKLLGISTGDAKEISKFITFNLNPYPGRMYWGNGIQETENDTQTYHQPDVIVSQQKTNPDGPLVVEVLTPTRGTLRINPLFRQSLKKAPLTKIDNWKKDIEQASLLIKCIQQRNNTMLRLMTKIVSRQREFILKGDEYLKPITRARLATELDVHESTISRAVSDKSVQIPNGRIVPIGRFFDRSLHIRAVLRKLVSGEKDALSDTQIAILLAKKGHQVARRTVAKYRSMEGILPAYLRRSLASQ
jgi:RNA polymerase sigma-54 factor